MHSLPLALCLVWAVILTMTAFRLRAFWPGLALTLVTGLFFLARPHVPAPAFRIAILGGLACLALLYLILLRKDGVCGHDYLLFIKGEASLHPAHILGPMTLFIPALALGEEALLFWATFPLIVYAFFLMIPSGKTAGTEEDMPTAPESVIYATTGKTGTHRALLSKFQEILIEDQIFLRPQLSLTDVADLLNTNKTYVSQMVNDYYRVGFPELINTLRIDYAEQYILNHRDAKQEEIAGECGFISASSFNNTFKKVTGMPPKQWVTNWDAIHRN